MTARRLALAWCWGSVCGLVVGFLVGESVRDLAAFRALRRAGSGPGAAQTPLGHSGTVEALNGAHRGAQPLIPSQRDDEPCPHTLGSLTCPFRGPHTSHAYQGIYAPDAKSDADERIE